MLADDVSLFSSNPNNKVAEAAIQEAITNVADLSPRSKLTLNASKCEVAFWQPSVQLDGALLTTTSLPKFLGVTIDRAFSFAPHIAEVVSKASNRCQVLALLISKRWGWRKDQLLKVYWPSSQCYELRCPSRATLAGPNPTGPAGAVPKQGSHHHQRTAQNHPSRGPPDRGGSPEHCNASSTTSCCGMREGPSTPNESPSQSRVATASNDRAGALPPRP